MNMKLWNFLERVAGIKKAVIYVENKNFEVDPIDGAEEHYWDINVEDADSETIEASFTLIGGSEDAVEKQKDFILSEYLSGENIVDVVELS